MAEPIDFYFDFGSPFAYIASTQIDQIGARHARDVRWRPYLMGVAFKQTGLTPLLDVPLKGDYSRRDIERSARFYGVEFRMPSVFPLHSVAASRAFYWAEAQDVEAGRRLAHALFRAYWVDDIDVGKAETVAEIATGAGLDRDACLAGMADAAVKDRLRAETDGAIRRGVFGSPFFFVDGEPFWGVDRLPQVERWLETGGW